MPIFHKFFRIFMKCKKNMVTTVKQWYTQMNNCFATLTIVQPWYLYNCGYINGSQLSMPRNHSIIIIYI